MSAHAISVILGTGKRDGPDSRSASEGFQRLVLLAIANIADNSGFCWHTVAQLAEAANVHRSTVNRHLDGLISIGELRMFKRGHYQAPVFVMTIVDHPLSTTEIADRLTEFDSRAKWRERRIDPAGIPIEVPVPGQGRLDFAKRSSQPATISEPKSETGSTSHSQPADQGTHHDRGRENDRNQPEEKIVADSDNLGEIVAGSDDIVAAGNEIVAVARRSSITKEPNRTTTTATTGEPLRGGGGEEPDPEAIARRWCDLTGRRFVGKIAEVYPRQVARFLTEHPPPSDEFLVRALDEGIKHPSGWLWVSGAAGAQNGGGELADCDRCDNRRWVAKAPNGHLVKVDSAEDYDTVVRCPSCWLSGEGENTG